MLKVAWKFVKEWEPSNRPSSFFFSLSSRSIEDERRLKGTFTGSSKPVPPNFLVTSTVNSGSGGDLFAFEFHSRSILHGRRKRKKKGEKGRSMWWSLSSSRCLRCDHRSNRATVYSGHARRGFIGAADSDVWEESGSMRSAVFVPDDRGGTFDPPFSRAGFPARVPHCESWDDVIMVAAARAAEGSVGADATTRRGANRPYGAFTRRSLWSLSPVTWTRWVVISCTTIYPRWWGTRTCSLKPLWPLSWRTIFGARLCATLTAIRATDRWRR